MPGRTHCGWSSRGWSSQWIRNCILAAAIAAVVPPAAVLPVQAAEGEFPFEVELLLDARPLPDSKRIPMLEIFEDGRAMIDLWCYSGNGRIEIKGDMVRVTFGQMRPQGCTQQRHERDEELAMALSKVTQWRLEEDVVVFVGPTELRFRLSSH
jgi:hypothetical protein